MDTIDGLPVLDSVEQRVIGSLLEKERTVPASYPMTLNALRTACNQSSSRFPILTLDDAAVTDAMDRLKARGLGRMVYAGSGARAVKYRQVLDEQLSLADDERAVLTVLLLRGPNAPGELKARTERLHRFDDRSEVEEVLVRLAARQEPLVRELERLPGHHDNRWVHLLGPVELAVPPGGEPGPSTSTAPKVDRDVVLADGAAARDDRVRTFYDQVAVAYGRDLAGELDGRPFDRWLLERLADLAEGGPVADAGCGPGHIGFHLAAAGADVTGFDLSPAMVDEARRRFPEVAFEVADLTDLPAPAAAPAGWAAIAAFYSLVHLAGSELRPAVALLATSLRPGGWLAVALHVGHEVVHVEELFGEAASADFVLHDRDQVVEAFHTAGLVEVEWYHRSPYDPAGAHATERLYVLGRRPR